MLMNLMTGLFSNNAHVLKILILGYNYKLFIDPSLKNSYSIFNFCLFLFFAIDYSYYSVIKQNVTTCLIKL